MAQKKGKRTRAMRGTAPSAPDLDKLETHHTDEQKVAQASDVDAMGQDKHRQIVGHAYGPSKRSQFLFFVAVGVLLVILIGGSLAAVAAFDQPPDSDPDEAPWSEADAAQIPPNDPSGPCGEPGNAHPIPKDSPCAQGTNSENEPASPGGGATLGGKEGEGQ